MLGRQNARIVHTVMPSRWAAMRLVSGRNNRPFFGEKTVCFRGTGFNFHFCHSERSRGIWPAIVRIFPFETRFLRCVMLRITSVGMTECNVCGSLRCHAENLSTLQREPLFHESGGSYRSVCANGYRNGAVSGRVEHFRSL